MPTITVPLKIGVETMDSVVSEIMVEVGFTYSIPYPKETLDAADFPGHAEVYSVNVKHPLLPPTEVIHIFPDMILQDLEQIAWESMQEAESN